MTDGESEASALDAALDRHARMRRRALLRALGGVAVVGALGTGGFLIYASRKAKSDLRLAVERARQAERAVLAGDIVKAKKLAAEARDLDPLGAESKAAYLHVGALDLIDGDGDANASVGLLAEARALQASNVNLAMVSLAAAVGVKNDRLSERILKEPREDDVTADGFYAFVAGAASDLDCDKAASGWYERAIELLPDGTLAQIRLARSLLFAGEIDRASKAVDLLPDTRLEKSVLAALVARSREMAGTPPAKASRVERASIGELPRSLRALGTALALQDPDAPWGQSAGLDAALDDIDSPFVALLAGRIALFGGDRVSARTASEAALRMREELDDARTFGARVALVDGDVAGAKKLIGDLGDKEMDATLRAIESYEKGPTAADVKDAARTEDVAWKLGGAANALFRGETPSSKDAALIDDGVKHGEPWADFLAVDAAFLAHDLERAKKIVATWTNVPPTPAQKARKERLDAGGAPRLPPPPDPKSKGPGDTHAPR